MNKAVLRAGDIFELHLDLACGAGRPAQQQVRHVYAEMVSPVALPSRQRIDHYQAACRRAEGGLQHHGSVQVAAGNAGSAGCPDGPVAGLLAQQATEDGWAVEAGQAQPVDGPVPANQGGAVTIREQGVIRDRGGAHGDSSFAKTTRRTSLLAVLSPDEIDRYACNGKPPSGTAVGWTPLMKAGTSAGSLSHLGTTDRAPTLSFSGRSRRSGLRLRPPTHS
jgi:hypothetical protein